MDEPGPHRDVWERKYAAGHAERYPWDSVVSFVFRNLPRDVPRSRVRILEVGCGTACNLWFAAREGFQASGIDGSASAIATARARLHADGLHADLAVGDFRSLPHPEGNFDLAIDRAAITCVGHAAAAEAVAEVRRVLVPGGRFFFNPYSQAHTSARSGAPGPDGVRLGISAGTLVGVGPVCFYDRAAVEALFASGWRILSMEHLERVDHADPACTVHAEWRVVAEKSG